MEVFGNLVSNSLSPSERRLAPGRASGRAAGGEQRPGGGASEQRRRSAVTPAPVGAEQKPARSPSRRPRSSSRPKPALPGSGSGGGGSGGGSSGASSSGGSGARSSGTCNSSAWPSQTAGAAASFHCDFLFLTPLAASSPGGRQRPWQDKEEEARWHQTNAARGVRIRAAVHHSAARPRKQDGAGVRQRGRQLLTGTRDAGDLWVTEAGQRSWLSGRTQ
ncbi:translation initiation factor IF-2-like [Physeter macrocephalus]|uniref:Translation initiation factor IF-2-like n=1 Tax=Physeter macrocephalus TaxID=9755 RepID=A0A455ARV6_PHYMC|nr:translation initiation factor IF-2-like [Physeter catodon]